MFERLLFLLLIFLDHTPQGNHILDDLIIDEFCQINQISYENLYQSEDCFLEYIVEIQKFFDNFQNELAKKFFTMINSYVYDKGIFILTQYPSVFETHNELFSWSKKTIDLLKNIKLIAEIKGYRAINKFLFSNLNEDNKRFIKEENILAMVKK